MWCKRTCLTSCGEAQQTVQMSLLCLTPYACSPDRSCERVHHCLQSLLLVRYWEWMLLQYFIDSLQLNSRIYRVCVQILVAFLPACAESISLHFKHSSGFSFATGRCAKLRWGSACTYPLSTSNSNNNCMRVIIIMYCCVSL